MNTVKQIPVSSRYIPQYTRKFFLPIWVLLLLALVALGVFGAYHLATREESAEIPWGILVPSYVFFALAATGSTLINSIFTVFNIKQFKPFIKKGVWLSLILIIPAVIFIVMDLGRWSHAYNLYFLFNPTSRIGWMGMLYVFYVISILVELVVVIKEDQMPKWAVVAVGRVVLIITLGVATNLGALFGAINSKPLLFNYFMPAHFIVSGVLAGAALQIMFFSICSYIKNKRVSEDLKNLFIRGYRPAIFGLILGNWLLLIIKFVPGILSTPVSPYVQLLITGPYSLRFWGFEILIGGILPLILLLNRKTNESVKWLFIMSILVIIGSFFSKYDLLIAAQSIAPFTTEVIQYSPPLIDVLLLVGGISLCLLCCGIGQIWLPLDDEERPKWLIFKFGKR